ncbi:Kinesin-like protein KIF23 [Zancudomyces culisetae]|uniref:Kinesin-like protein KIF23 n=1 Tax=Zancudomyces culisetae TaxID=1213189 RepID=A0A1R1PR04_ZANCU|nr:Kinesin-like protein KIF23 [Zancudomyces culisetae]|eukprot:OMH83333.1 Kinesin-like protein KIF23 [Zancudomyces culisetae]
MTRTPATKRTVGNKRLGRSKLDKLKKELFSPMATRSMSGQVGQMTASNNSTLQKNDRVGFFHNYHFSQNSASANRNSTTMDVEPEEESDDDIMAQISLKEIKEANNEAVDEVYYQGEIEEFDFNKNKDEVTFAELSEISAINKKKAEKKKLEESLKATAIYAADYNSSQSNKSVMGGSGVEVNEGMNRLNSPRNLSKGKMKWDPKGQSVQHGTAETETTTGIGSSQVVSVSMKVLNDKEIEVYRRMVDTSGKRERYLFAGVLPETVTGDTLYGKTTAEMTRKLITGKNGLLFTYGTTGSGKTYSMQGTDTQPGLIYRAVGEVLHRIQRLNRQGMYAKGLENGVLFEGGYSLRPKCATQVEWCNDLRVVDPKIRPIFGERGLIESVESLYSKEEGEESESSSDESVDEYTNTGVYRYALYLSCYEVHNEVVYDLLDLKALTGMEGPSGVTSTGAGRPGAKGQGGGTGRRGRPPKVKPIDRTLDIQTPEELRGLGKRSLLLRSETGKGIHTFLDELTEVRISTATDMVRVLMHAQIRRNVNSTGLNASSSRSHAICVARVVKWKATRDLNPHEIIPVSAEVTMSTLTLVDLAGSERAKSTRNVGDRLVESNNINLSLMALKRCMDSLRFNSEVPPNQMQLVPYNGSKLTRLLQPSLEGGAKTVMLVCIDPNQVSGPIRGPGTWETLNVLEFAHVASTIVLSEKQNKTITRSTVRADPSNLPHFMSPTKTKLKNPHLPTSNNNTLLSPSQSAPVLIESDEEDYNQSLAQLMLANNSRRPSEAPMNGTSLNKSTFPDSIPLIKLGRKRTIDLVNQFEFAPGNSKKPKTDLLLSLFDGKLVSAFPKRRRAKSLSDISTRHKDTENNDPQPVHNSNCEHSFLLGLKKEEVKDLMEQNSVLAKKVSEVEKQRDEFEFLSIKRLNAFNRLLKQAKESVSEANDRAVDIELKIRSELGAFHLQQIKKLFSEFRLMLDDAKEINDTKMSQKLKLLADYYLDFIDSRADYVSKVEFDSLQRSIMSLQKELNSVASERNMLLDQLRLHKPAISKQVSSDPTVADKQSLEIISFDPPSNSISNLSCDFSIISSSESLDSAHHSTSHPLNSFHFKPSKKPAFLTRKIFPSQHNISFNSSTNPPPPSLPTPSDSMASVPSSPLTTSFYQETSQELNKISTENNSSTLTVNNAFFGSTNHHTTDTAMFNTSSTAPTNLSSTPNTLLISSQEPFSDSTNFSDSAPGLSTSLLNPSIAQNLNPDLPSKSTPRIGLPSTFSATSARNNGAFLTQTNYGASAMVSKVPVDIEKIGEANNHNSANNTTLKHTKLNSLLTPLKMLRKFKNKNYK